MSASKTFADAAADLRFKAGFSIIPLGARTKNPIGKWEKYQRERVTLGDIEFWWGTSPTRMHNNVDEEYNIGVVCGKVSGNLVVIDVDPRHGGSLELLTERFGITFENAVMVKTGGNGWHIYYRSKQGERLRTVHLLPGVEFRCEGSMVVAPPSVHPETRKTYEWVHDPYHFDIQGLPDTLLNAVRDFEKRVGNTVTGFGEEPSSNTVNAIVQEVCLEVDDKADRQSEAIHKFMSGVFKTASSKEADRSGWSYTLARLLLEKGIIGTDEPIKLAIAVYGSNVHQAKFAKRHDRWLDACRIAQTALDADCRETFDDTIHEVVGDQYKLPPFPEKICVGIIGDIARALDEICEAPLPYLYHAAITSFSSFVSGNATLKTSLKIKPTLYTILLGYSSQSRKSTAIDKVTEFFSEALGNIFSDIMYQGFFGSGEGVLKKLADVGAKNPQGTASVLWSVDEFEQVIARSTMEHSILAPLLQTLYESDQFEYMTASKQVKVSNAHISLLSSSTIDTFSSMWERRLTEGGLLNRLWLVAPHQPKRLVLPPDMSAEGKALQEQLRQLIWELDKGPTIVVDGVEKRIGAKKRSASYTIPFSDGAREAWEEFYLEQLPQMVEEAPEAARRLETYGLRFALLTALSRKEFDGISRDTMERVLSLLMYQYGVRKALKPIDAKTDSARLEQLICRKLCSGSQTKRELYRNVSGQRYGAGMFEHALDNLAKVGFISIKREQGKSIVIKLVEQLTD